MNILKALFGGGNKIDFLALVAEGAVIVDVRSKSEYDSGHIAGSLHIPLQNLEANLNRLPKDKPIITCCASGMRSGSAKSILESNGFEAHNGGGWSSLQGKISQ